MNEALKFRGLIPVEETVEVELEDSVILIDMKSEKSFPVTKANGEEFGSDQYGLLADIFQYLMREAIEQDILSYFASIEDDETGRTNKDRD